MPTFIYHGHACFELEGKAGRVIIDPFLTGNRLADIRPDQLLKVDAVLLTHGHGDHVGDGLDIARRHGALVVAPYELALFCRDRGCQVHPMHIGGSHDFTFGTVKLVVAFHGGKVEGDDTGKYTTFPCGFVVTLDGKRTYHTGDTALTLEMRLLQDQVDVMLVPIGGNFTMGVEDAARAVEFVRPKVAVPMHYNTFDVITADPDAFRRAVGTTASVVVMKPGQRYEF